MVDSEILSALIKKAGYTQTEIAKKLGITTMTLNRKIRNHTEFTASELFALSTILSIPIDSPIFFNTNVTDSKHS